MNEENKKQNILISVLTWVLTIGLNTGAFAVGAVCRGKFPFAAELYGLCIGLLLLAMAVSGLVGTRYAKSFGDRNVRDANDDADQRRSRMAEDSRREWRRLQCKCILSIAYICLLILLCLAVPLFFGASGLDTQWMTANLISMFTLSGFVGRWIRPGGKISRKGILPEREFPLLYSLFRETAGKRCTGKKLHIRVMHGIPDEECTAAVALERKHVTLLLGSTLLCVADEGELRQVMLHELAHMEGEEIRENRLFNRVMGYINSDGRTFFTMLADWALTLPLAMLMIEGQFYFMLSSRQKETRADDWAAAQGDPEKQASVLAKICAFNLYTFEREPYESVFVSEKIPQHLMTDRAKAYRKALADREGDWRRLLENEIPSRVASHPTFRQRWEALGCCDYSLAPAAMDTAFSRECWAAAETADADRASISQERYDELRQQAYGKHLAIVEEFESRDWDLTPDELRPPMLAYYSIGKPEKMEALCDRVLAENDSPFATAFSKYWKGILLLHRYDNHGLAYLYEAMEANTNYIEDGLELIGSYCTRMGLQQELEEYRVRAPKFLQLKKDRSSEGINAKAQLSAETLPEGWQTQILDFILRSGGEDIGAVYLVKHTVAEDYAPSAFVLRFRENVPEQRQAEISDKVFRLLDDWPKDWEFSLYEYEDAMEKPLGRVPGSCIYSAQGGQNERKQ